MIYSMTAYARSQVQSQNGILTCEMRSINHRYLEISVFLPDVMRVMEMPIRECIRKTIKRGKVECSVRFQPTVNGESALFNLNSVLAQELCKAGETIATFLKNAAPIEPTDILRFPGVMETPNTTLENLQADVMQLIDKTIQDLLSARAREGEVLKELFLQRLTLMEQELTKVKERYPQVLEDQRERLFKRFSDAKVELDANRLEQEMVIYAQRIDVTEEIDRIYTHISEMRRVLDQGGIVGRRVDFLLQELNREANTMGSKSIDPIITHAAVEVKVLIEQIREQIQNIE